MGVGGQHHAPAALPLGKTRYPLYRRLGGPQGRSGRVRKIWPPTGIRSPDRPARSESLYRLRYCVVSIQIWTRIFKQRLTRPAPYLYRVKTRYSRQPRVLPLLNLAHILKGHFLIQMFRNSAMYRISKLRSLSLLPSRFVVIIFAQTFFWTCIAL